MTGAEVLFYSAGVFISLGYFFLLIYFFRALRQKWTAHEIERKREPDLTVILPFRNEKEHLAARIADCKRLAVKAIFVNDHSTDLSREELDTLFAKSSVELYHLSGYSAIQSDSRRAQFGYGKKAALHLGIAKCDTSWVLTTDADTAIEDQWYASLGFLDSKDIQAYVLPVAPSKSTSLIARFFDLEFLALQAVGLASARVGRPLLANGAAFLFKKSAYLSTYLSRTDLDLPGGDDVFTLQAIVHAFGESHVAPILEYGPAVVSTFPSNAGELWWQRLRWISKVPDVNLPWYSWVSWLALLSNGVQLLCYAMLLSGAGPWWLLPAALKIMADLLLLAWGVSYFRRLDCVWLIVPALLVYPFYFFALLATAVLRKYRWK